jgi:lycopene cyclase domain-containing protein
VAFYKKWKHLFSAMILPAVFYIIWDMVFTKQGVWSFNENYITGIKLYNLPIEEVLFFFVVPYCCVFIYACVRSYFPKIQRTSSGNGILNFIGIVLLVIALFYHDKAYTFFTFFFNGIFIFILSSSKRYFQSFNANAFLVSYLIILIPFLIINGLLTAIPVVLYNDNENLATRIYTIPVEDVFYGMLLIMMNVVGYEFSIEKSQGKQ